MMHGDISNQMESVFGVRLYPEVKTKHKGFLNLMKGQVIEAFIDKETLDFINYVYKKTPFSVYGLIDEKVLKTPEIKAYLDMLPVSKYLYVENVFQCSDLVDKHVIDYLVDVKSNNTYKEATSLWVMNVAQANTILGR